MILWCPEALWWYPATLSKGVCRRQEKVTQLWWKVHSFLCTQPGWTILPKKVKMNKVERIFFSAELLFLWGNLTIIVCKTKLWRVHFFLCMYAPSLYTCTHQAWTHCSPDRSQQRFNEEGHLFQTLSNGKAESPWEYEKRSMPGVESAWCLMGMMMISGSLWTFSGGLAKGDGSGSAGV